MRIATVNICQPGYGASCALCCGSHNFITSPGNAAAVYRRRASAGGGPILEPLQADAIQCAHVGFIEKTCETIGCLIYRNPPEENTNNRFFTYTCKNFSCAAREMLTDEQIVFAARLMGDWYYYSLLITDIPLLQSYSRDFGDAGRVSPQELARLKERLREMLGETSLA